MGLRGALQRQLKISTCGAGKFFFPHLERVLAAQRGYFGWGLSRKCRIPLGAAI
jgi:hypothetical protein